MTAAPRTDVFTPQPKSPDLSADSLSRPGPSSRVSSFGGSGHAGSGMKLGAVKPKLVGANLMDELAAEMDDDEVANAWGTDDLMDVNADTDDWSTSGETTTLIIAAFESAPEPVAAPPPQSYYTQPKTEPTPKPKPAERPIVAPKPVKAVPTPKSPPPAATASPVSDASKPSTPAPNLSAMTKEEKEKEMARRREERKARIAAMKKK